MKTNLTLSIEDQIINSANEYAKIQGVSLSSSVEDYLRSITKETSNDKESQFHHLVEELSGSINDPKGKSYHEVLREVRVENYSGQ